jgi:hypothetical protein
LPGGVALENSHANKDQEICIGECRCNIPVCFHRARLHLPLARLGKTALTTEERNLIAPDDPDGGVNLFDGRVRNPIFVYDLTQMKQAVAVNDTRPDVTITNPDQFRSIIETYKHDPCNRLIRRESDGEYILDPSIGNGIMTINSDKVKYCKGFFHRGREKREEIKKMNAGTKQNSSGTSNKKNIRKL